MGDPRIGRVLRFVASRGMADKDADVVADLLSRAHRLADLVGADTGSSAEVRSLARQFVEQLDGETFGEG